MESTKEQITSIPDIQNQGLVTDCDQLPMPIENRILTLRGKQVMIDRDLADIFKSGEIDENSVRSILEPTAADGKIYKTPVL